jgi:hypothetical protein
MLQTDQPAQWTPAGRRQAYAGLMVLIALTALVGSAGGATPALGDPCPNAVLRAGLSAHLPDCRAYELVSPPSKGAVDIDIGGFPAWASADGSHVIMLTADPLPGSPAGNIEQRLSGTRTPAGWTDTILTTPGEGFLADWSDDFSHQIYVTRDVGRFVEGEESAPETNVFLRNPDGSFAQVSDVTNDHTALGGAYVGASADFGQILFGSCQSLLPGVPTNLCAQSETELYEWNRGALSVVGVLPDGVIASGGAIAFSQSSPQHVISADGSRVVFASPSSTGGVPPPESQIYLRANGVTVDVSASQRIVEGVPTPDPNGRRTPAFVTATADDSIIFFQSEEELTSDANTNSDTASDLYAYDVNARSLTDLTASPEDPGGGQFQGLLGTSADGARAYFVADGVLPGTAAKAGQPNLYRWDRSGTVELLATLSQGDDLGASGRLNVTSAEVTPDGNHLLFLSRARITSYDSAGRREAYVYDAHTNAITCVSCDPSGVAPTNDASLPVSRNMHEKASRAISDDGRRVFFQTAEELVPRAIGKRQNVYEYESGQVLLISSGAGSDDSTLISSSATGEDVFFLTRDRLAPQDTDNNVDLYDARVDGGFAHATTANAGCTGDACQGQPSPPPLFATPSSLSLSGPGNLVQPAPEPAAKPPTGPQKLSNALKACRAKYDRRKRARCEARARHRGKTTRKRGT